MHRRLSARIWAAWRSTYGRLVLLVLLALVPVLLFSTVMVVDRTRSEQAEIEKRLDGEAQALARGIDDLIESMRTDLEVLAVAPALLNEDFAAFHAYLTAVADARGYIINLVAPERRFLLSSAAPFGTIFTTPAPEFVTQVFNGAPYRLSDLGPGLLTNHPRALIAVPVRRGGVVVYVLTGSVFAERLMLPVSRMRLSEGWTAAVVDGRGTFVARSRDIANLIGRPAPPGALALMERGVEGIARGRTNDGQHVVAALRRATSGWWAAVSISQEAWSAPLRQSLFMIGIGAVAALALSLILATLFAGRIARQIGGLADAAEALGAGRPVPAVASSLTEVDEVGRALREAGERIRRGEADLRESEARLSLAQEVAQIGTFEFETGSGTMIWSPALFLLYGRDPALGPPSIEAWMEMIHPTDRARAASLIQKADKEGGAYVTDHRIVLPNGQVRWVAVRGRVFPAQGDRERRMIGVNYDVSDRKLREERQALMVRELHHRVKNTLATVQAIIGSTARTATDMDTFREGVIGRIASLARTHTMLTDTGWSDIEFSTLVGAELEPYGNSLGRIRTSGPSVTLAADIGIALGMVIHELSTNAAKYGALSVPQGEVNVSWTVEGGPPATHLCVDWRESGGPAPVETRREGFGSRLMTRVLTHQLKAEVDRRYDPDGFKCTIRLPLTAGVASARAA